MASGNLPPWLAQAAGKGDNSGPSKGAIARRMKKKKGNKNASSDTKNSDQENADQVAG